MRIDLSVLLIIASVSVLGCHPREPKPAPEADYLLVDRQVTDFSKTVSPDGLESSFNISCDASWEVSVQEEAESWISVGEKQSSGKHSWTIPYSVTSNENLYPRTGLILFKAGEHSVQVTLEQGAPDPLTLNRVPGFYGFEGVNVFPTGSRQSSSFRYGNTWSYRIIDPSAMSVYALGNIPWDLESGSRISVSYKVLRRGMEISYEPSIEVEVVRSTASLVWLRRTESQYFIIER